MSYTSRILNYVEPYYIDGIAKTAFWTEVNTNLVRNDKVFIINGYYDSERFIKKGKWTKNADGYRVLFVDRCKVVVDIDWESGTFAGLTQTYRVDEFDNFIKLSNIRSQREFDYINKIYVDSYTSSRVSKFEKNYTNNIIYSYTDWAGATGLGGNSGLGATNSFWARVGYDWVNVTSQYLNNNFTFSSEYISKGLTNNSRLFILGEDLTYQNVLLKERNIYKWNATASWLLDTEYKQPIMSKLYFRTGVFKGIHNDGVFGTYLKSEQWNGWPSEWNSGFFVNSVWNAGRMKSKSTIFEASYYSTLVNGSPVQSTDFSDNRGYGYNYILDSDFISGSIDNGNFVNSNIGSYSTGLTAIDEYFGVTNSYLMNITGGLYSYCDIYNSYLYSSTTVDSIIRNTFFEDTRTLNSQIKESYSKDGEFSTEEASINIISADMSSYMITATSGTSSSIRSILKLYIEDKDLIRLDNLDSFYLSNIDKEYLLSKLDSDTRIWLPIETKYILDTFYNFEVGAVNQECISSIKTKYENKFINIVEFDGMTYSNNSIVNDKVYASIDIDFSKYFAFYKYLEQYYYVNESYIDKSNVTNAFKNTKITNSDFRDGVAKNIIWNSGSHLNYPSNVIKWENNNLKISKVATDQIKVYLVATQSTINDGLFSTGSWAWLDSIVHTDNNGSQSLLTGAYTIANYTQDELTLQSSLLTGVSSSGTYSVLGTHKPKYLSVHKLLIEDSVVRKGLFIRNLFRNTLFEDESFDSNDRSLHNSNVQKLRILNHYFINSSNSVNTIKSGVFHNSHFTDINWLSGISDNSIWYGPEFKNGVFNYGIWQDGTFSGGVFQNSRGISYSVEDYSLVNTHYRNWFKGTFNGGDFYNSVWLDGTFNLGKFYGSDWYGGIWNNGILGDMNIPTSNTTMAKYLNIGTGATFTNWYNGMVDNAEVGGQGYIDWYNGKFNAGIFSSSASTSTNRSWWLDGQFNGGNFSGLAKWKKGTFNSGKFNSYYGFTLSSSTSSIDYGWEYGEFKGGQFGEQSTFTNSTWFDGQFFDGIFKGKVWNSGIFLGGVFEGSGTISSISNTEIFSNSFSQSYWGLWRSGTVTDLKHKADPSFVVPVNTTRVDEVIPQVRATLKNMLWVNGNFEHPYGEMANSIWLSGKFKRGKFSNGVFNPFVRRDWWVDSYGTYSTFNFDFSNCVWENGDFDGDFYISDWLEGNFIGGTMSGARWFDGVWKYGNARNIYWENGTWKNGNWDGSPFDLNTLNFTQSEHRMVVGKEKDILLRVANVHQDGKIHVINAFTGSFSDNLFEGWTFSNTSPELSDWNNAFSYWYLDYGLPSNPTITLTETQFNTPDGYNTSTIVVSDPVVESDIYRVFVYDGYISLTASSTDNADSIASRLIDQINNGIIQQIVKKDEWTTNGYLTRYFTWQQIDNRLGYTLPYALPVGSGIFTIQTPSDGLPYVNAQSGFAGSSIYKQSEKIYAMIDDGTGLTTSIFTQSEILHNVSIDVYNFSGRTDFLVNVADNIYRETMTSTGYKTLNYSFRTIGEPDTYTASTLYIERVIYENPDNSSFQVQDVKINRLESFYDNIINNRLYKFGTYSPPFIYGPTGTTVSLPGKLLTGLVANNEPVSIKYGNGAFKLGLWENGFWNNGWRAAWNSQEKEYSLFTDIIQGGFLQIIENLWVIQLRALTNTNEISIGDRVSIGNLVFIDINEKRRLIKKWFRVINKTIDTINVEINVNFSVRRIEKDSSAHLIYVSKNIWESGVFHNGYFKGIWNYGLFRGYPYITEMVQSHWVDGIFDGGTFKSDKSYYLSQGLSQSYNNGLIQNFIFRDNNRDFLPGKFKFDSWVDTNYFTSSMTNLFKDNLRYDSDWGVILSSGNLKGYPTEDVLSSISIFRNSFDNAVKYYSLGYKYKNYVDFLKSASYFTYPFNTNGAPGVSEFLAQGWTYTANFINLHSNSVGGRFSNDDNVLQVNYQQEAYSNVGVKFVQTKKIQYRNGNKHVTTRSRDPIYKWIDGDFSSSARYTVFINDIAQPAGTRFSNRSYLYDDFPLRTSISGQQKLNNNIENKETLSLFTNTSTSINAPSSWTLGGDTENSWRRVYMLDLFNPTQSDTSFGGYNIAGLTPNVLNEIVRSGTNGSNVGGSSPTWTFMQYYVVNDTRLKINAFIPFEFSADETADGGGLGRRNGWSTFKMVGVIEKLAFDNPSNDEDKWKYVTGTEFNFYPDSYFLNNISNKDLFGYLVNKTNCTIVFDTTNSNKKLRGFLKIDGYEENFKKGDKLRFRLYWIDVRKMFASSNQTGDGAPGDMTLTIGKFSGIDYSENNHGYWEIVDLSTYVNKNTNLLTNTNASKIEKFRYSVVDFDIKSKPSFEYQGTSSTPSDLLPSIFLLNSDYVGLPGNFNEVINHGLTIGNKKEYFYNRKSLDMFFRSTESFSVQFSKIQFYETDMIPFFRYTDESAVNKDPQSPYYGTAPLEPIAEGSLSLDTISFTSPFQGNIPIAGAIQIPGGGGIGSGPGDITLPPPPPPFIVYNRIDYTLENESDPGINEFTSYYSISEYTSTNSLVRTISVDHANTDYTTGFLSVEATNYLELFVRGTYSTVAMNNQSRIIIPAISPYPYDNISLAGNYSQLTHTFTPTTDLVINLQVKPELIGYYYLAYAYDCTMMSTYGSLVTLLSYSSISLGYYVCVSGSPGIVYQLSSIIGPTTQDFTIISSNAVCSALSCYIP